ncbi:PREDICTED: ATP-dependent DNA helicase 2 subunit KU70-like [Ipomoea nil]|uniref:ATP-dependent DNA helicase 2 subunit KU70-like n=1 Tax=Ipomoea nil TaxID=35883 RepID=UPI00090179A3|nr:PREDICTED: ATP-dependent DNA helicase 2 subunit KU70-like [Ipomoea nil]
MKQAVRFEDLKDQLRMRLLKKRKVKRIQFVITNGGLSIELNTYALIRPTNPGTITWLDSVSNLPIKHLPKKMHLHREPKG